MKRLYLAATVLLSCSVAFGATITGNLKLITGAASPDRRVTFQPMDPPWSDGINLYLPDATSVTSVDGVFSATLAAGSYRVTVGGQNVGYIRVPVGTDTYSMTQLPAAHFAYLSAIEGGDNVTVTTNATGAIVISATSEIQTAWGDLTGVPANITAWESIDPATKQPASVNLTNWSAIATSTKQDADADLTRFASIGAGTAGDILYRDATGWTNLTKGTDGEVLKLTSGYPAWEADEGTSGEWGSITGTLSLQSDLAGVLDSKAATNHVHDTSDISTGLLSADRLPVNSELTGGIVSQPTASDTNAFWQTDANGVPGWRRLENLDVGTVTATNLSLASGLGEDGQVVKKVAGVLTWGTDEGGTVDTNEVVLMATNSSKAYADATFLALSATNDFAVGITNNAKSYADSLTNTVVAMSTNAAQANATSVFAPIASPTFTGTINGENLELSGSVGGTTLYWTGGLPGHIYMDANTNLANVDATAEAAMDKLETLTFGTTGALTNDGAGNLGWYDLSSIVGVDTNEVVQMATNSAKAYADAAFTQSLSFLHFQFSGASPAQNTTRYYGVYPIVTSPQTTAGAAEIKYPFLKTARLRSVSIRFKSVGAGTAGQKLTNFVTLNGSGGSPTLIPVYTNDWATTDFAVINTNLDETISPSDTICWQINFPQTWTQAPTTASGVIILGIQ